MKHKLISSCIILMMAMASMPNVLANDYDFSAVAPSGQELYYKRTSYNTVMVTYALDYDNLGFSHIETSGDLIIPSSVTYNRTTYTVTHIGESAFAICDDLTSVTIPNSVTSIGNWAFGGCTGLTSVTIPNSVTSIGNWAFGGCTGLTSVSIPNSVTSIGEEAFYGCTGLTSVSIGNSVTSIGSSAFYGCTGLTSITIGESITSIGNNAFNGCTSLTAVAIPNSVTSIGDATFYGCTGLASITIGESVTSIGNNAFTGCTSLTAVTIPNSVTSIGDATFYGCTGLDSITIGESVTSIGNNAFTGCTSLTSITIPKYVTSIGSYAFGGCNSLTSVFFYAYRCTSMGSNDYPVFGNCPNLTTVSFGDSVEIIPDNAFRGCTGLTSVTIPNSMTSIGNYAFNSCTSLTAVTIPNSVTSIGNYAFNSCTSLTSITIPKYVTSIGRYAFRGCNSLTTVFFYAYRCTSMGTYDYPVFSNCQNLTTVSLGDSVEIIPDNAFRGCTGLTSVTIPNSMTSIGNDAFNGCTSLTSITIPKYVTSIGRYAFGGCTRLTTVFFYAYRCTSMGSNDDPVFSNCQNLTTVSFGDSVEIIPDNAFRGCTRLTSVTIPNSVTSIGNDAFNSCTRLTSITIPKYVTSIGRYAFGGCNSLTSVFFYAYRCASMGNYYPVFSNCPNLTTVSFGDSVEIIPDNAFSGCTGLTSVTIPNSVTSIGEGAFHDCTGLTSVTIPNSVTSIGYYTFNGCTSLTSVLIPNSVTSIGFWAFHGCSSLTSVTIGNSVTSICAGAFADCTLDTVYLNPVTPPTFEFSGIGSAFDVGVFHNNAPNRVFIINNCSFDNYYTNNDWQVYRDYLRRGIIDINIHVVPNDSARGVVGIEQQYDHDVSCDSTTIIFATANEGYYFDHWSNGSTNSPDTLTLIGDSNVTAIFERNLYTLSANVSDASLGSLSLPNSNTALYLDTLMVVARTTDHYHVDHWSGISIVDSSVNKDTIWVIMNSDISVTCHFAIDRHTVTVAVNDIARGTVNPRESEFDYGKPCTLVASAYTGYTFKCWSNGVTANPYVFAVTEDVNLTAIFMAPGEESFTVTATSTDPQMGSATANGFPSATVMNGETVTLVATANEGYHFVRWNDNNTNATRTITVTSDMSFTAYFETDFIAPGEESFTVTATSADPQMGSATANGFPSATVMNGETVTLVATANEGYHFVRWNDNNTDATRTITVTSDMSFTAYFETDFIAPGEESFTVTAASADPQMGSATANGFPSATVMNGETVTLVATANNGYHFVRWNDNNTDATRTITVTSDMCFTAYFEADESPTEGIGEIQTEGVKVYARNGRIVVEGAADETVRVFDIVGRPVRGQELKTGVYIVKIGLRPAKKIVVMR